MKQFFATVIVVVLISFSNKSISQGQEYFPDPDPLVQQRLEEWQDMKFGLLMHWGA